MQKLRLLMSAGIAGLAVIGLVVRRRSPWLPLLAALAFGPFALLALQSYGGEMALRIYLFLLPAACILAGCFFFADPKAGRALLRMLTLMDGDVALQAIDAALEKK